MKLTSCFHIVGTFLTYISCEPNVDTVIEKSER